MKVSDFYDWSPCLVIASRSIKNRLHMIKVYADFEKDSLKYKVVSYNIADSKHILYAEVFYTLDQALKCYEKL